MLFRSRCLGNPRCPDDSGYRGLKSRCRFRNSGLCQKGLANFQPRFVKLRLGIADGAMQKSRDFLMPVALHIVQQKDAAVGLRELANCTDQRDPVESSPEATVILTEIDLPTRSVGSDYERKLTH